MDSSEETPSRLMTVGELSKRTGMTVKALREFEAMGLIYSAGRTAGNYRLFDETALWCVQVIRNLRALGLTVAEIRALAGIYLERSDEPVGPHLAERLVAVRARIDARVAELEQMRRRIDDFERDHADELAGRPGADFHTRDPRATAGA